MALAARTLYTGCDFPLWMQWGIVVYGSIIIFLFINFYVHAYIRPTADSAKSKVRYDFTLLSVYLTNKSVNK